MSTATQLPVSDYLHTSYSPDCDYVDGELQERNVGELDHAEVQGALLHWFRSHDKEWNIRAFPEIPDANHADALSGCRCLSDPSR